jgi:hypothetical protein
MGIHTLIHTWHKLFLSYKHEPVDMITINYTDGSDTSITPYPLLSFPFCITLKHAAIIKEYYSILKCHIDYNFHTSSRIDLCFRPTWESFSPMEKSPYWVKCYKIDSVDSKLWSLTWAFRMGSFSIWGQCLMWHRASVWRTAPLTTRKGVIKTYSQRQIRLLS